MKNGLGVDKTPSALERSFKAAAKVSRELPTDIEMESIPLEELLSLVEIFMLRHGKHYKTPALTCENF